MPPSERTTITFPRPRFEQLRQIAEKMGLPNPGAVIDAWISRAIQEGVIPDELPGYSVVTDEDVIGVEIGGHWLPLVKFDRGRLLHAVLAGAAGKPASNLVFKLDIGKAVEVDLGPMTLGVGRHGRGVLFKLTDKRNGQVEKFAAPAGYIIHIVDRMRKELFID